MSKKIVKMLLQPAIEIIETHLDKESRLAEKNTVRGTKASENSIDRGQLTFLSRNKGSYLGQDGNQTRLTKQRALA